MAEAEQEQEQEHDQDQEHEQGASLLGLFQEPEEVAAALDQLRAAGFADRDLEVLSGTPYPPGTFGEATPPHHLFVFALVGAACGFAVGLLITIGTQLSYPLVTGGKPILSLPPMINVLYEGTLLGAIIFTTLGALFESRLPRFGEVPYDARITTEGYFGVVVRREGRRGQDTSAAATERILRAAGALEISRGAG